MASQHRSPFPRPDRTVLRRWGLGDGDRIDRPALMDSLARLQVDERPLSSDKAGLVDRIRRRCQNITEVIADAVAVADACEADHAADERWPHGLSDRLVDLLEGLEQHQHREDAVVFPLFLSGSPRASATAALMVGEHGSIRHKLDALSAVTRAYETPARAGPRWRILYLLCRKVDFEIRAQMLIEDRDLLVPMVRDSTEAETCPAATSSLAGSLEPERSANVSRVRLEGSGQCFVKLFPSSSPAWR